MLPNFLIVGGMKCGTSALAHYLNEHPDVFIPGDELHFFNSEDAYKAGLKGYEECFRLHNGEAAVGEKTPTYSYHPLAPERIARALPDARLVWIFRNPVDRAYSHYWFFVSMGKERLSFEEALAREPLRMKRDFTMAYRDRSVYSTQVKNYLNLFSRDQMLFLLWEDLKRDPKLVLSKTCEFLGVRSDYEFTRVGTRRNVTYMPRSVSLQWLSYQLFSRKGARILRQVKKLNRVDTAGYPPMSVATRRSLESFFEPHNEELSDLTGLNLSAWKRESIAVKEGQIVTV